MPRASAPAFDPSHACVRQPPTPESRGDLEQPRFRDELCPAKAEHSSELAAADRPSTLGARPGTRDPTVAGGDAFLIPMPTCCFVLDGSCSMDQAEGVAPPLPVELETASALQRRSGFDESPFACACGRAAALPHASSPSRRTAAYGSTLHASHARNNSLLRGTTHTTLCAKRAFCVSHIGAAPHDTTRVTRKTQYEAPFATCSRGFCASSCVGAWAAATTQGCVSSYVRAYATDASQPPGAAAYFNVQLYAFTVFVALALATATCVACYCPGFFPHASACGMPSQTHQLGRWLWILLLLSMLSPARCMEPSHSERSASDMAHSKLLLPLW